MAGGSVAKLIFSKSIYFLPPSSLRRLSTAAVNEILAPAQPGPTAHRVKPPSTSFCAVDYLIDSCGLSEKDAEAASPALSKLRSPEKPDAVLRFLRDRGLGGDDIADFVSRKPRLLCAHIGSDLASKFDFLIGVGFSVAEVVLLMQKANLLNDVSLSFVKKRVEFLRSILEKDADMRRVINKTVWIFTGAIERRLADNIAKLSELGVPFERIKALLVMYPRFFLVKSETVHNAASVAEGEFGITRSSKMFVPAVVILTSNSERGRQSKYEVFESFGWKKSDIVALFRTFPNFMQLGVATLTKKMEFLVNKAGCDATYIIKYGSVLGMSLERRIIPRYELLCALKAQKIPSKKLMSGNFCYAASLSEKRFQTFFVNEFMELERDACQVYMSSLKLEAN